MKIALFHYHLRPGGVTEVIVQSVRNILALCPDLEEVRLVCGETDNADRVVERIRSGFERNIEDKVRLDVLDELRYRETGTDEDVDRLSRRLEARYPEDVIWWVHNYHLGKNPVFTAALMSIASEGKRNMLLQIHDFPECGRQENLSRLDRLLRVPPYPSGPRIRYAVINERDRKILSDAGLEDSVSLLLDPVPLDTVSDIDPLPVREAIRKTGTHGGFLPDAPVLIYPVRAIRRKNVIEAAFVARILDEPANLIVTLPGVSDRERRYSDTVAGLFDDGLVPGAWCPELTGDPNLRYGNLVALADAVISTSIQEGFGYLFLNALHWRKPLLARYLDILDGILELFGDYPRRFWADLRIPADPDLISKTRTAYQEKIRRSTGFIHGKTMKSVLSATSKLASGGSIDFSYLSVEDQLAVLRRVNSDSTWLEEVRLLNRELLDSFGRTIRAKAPSMDRFLETHFGPDSYVRSFREIVGSFGDRTHSPNPVKIRESVLKSFGRIDYLRLIYDF